MKKRNRRERKKYPTKQGRQIKGRKRKTVKVKPNSTLKTKLKGHKEITEEIRKKKKAGTRDKQKQVKGK